MRTIDLGALILGYNFVIGILLMLSSNKIASYAGRISTAFGGGLKRYTQVATVAFGATVASLSGAIYLFFHVLRIGIE